MNEYQGGTDWANEEDVQLTDEFLAGMPKPLYWRVLVMPLRPKEKTASGIVIPREAQDAQSYLNYVGKVVALGDLAYQHERFERQKLRPAVGDYVVYGRYAGQPMTYRGVKLLTLNEDEMLCLCPDPEALQIHV